MKKNLTILLLMFSFSCSYDVKKDNELRVMTYNIRYASETIGEEWSLRKAHVTEMVRFHHPDIFGLQEAIKLQVDYFESEFPNYSWYGVGRDDGNTGGEYSPIFFNEKFNFISGTTLWLSPTPDVPSIGWDAALNRIATKISLLIRETNDTMYVYNTHFDHIGDLAREKSAELIINDINKISENCSVILMGDFNITDSAKAYSILNSSSMKDANNNSSFNNYGTAITFNGFDHDLNTGEKIDYIFTNKNVRVLHHGVIGDKFDGKYPSDHMPVLISFKINNNK